MIKKKLTKMLACLLSASCLLATTSALNVSADEEENTNANTQVFVLNEEDNGQPPIYYGSNSGISTYGASKPSNGDMYNLLLYTEYRRQIDYFKHLVYTDTCFRVEGKLVVTIEGDSIADYLANYVGKPGMGDHYVSIELHEYYQENGRWKTRLVDKLSRYAYGVGDTLTAHFYNLDPSVPYFIAVSKSTADDDYIRYIYLTVSTKEHN